MLAFTGLETVANLAAEARRPGVDLPRSVFGGIATVVTMYVAIAVVALSAFPGPHTELGGRWIRAPLLGVAHRIGDELPGGLGGVLEFYVGHHRRADPARRGDDVDLRLLAARLLARRARPAAAQLRPAEPARARLAAGDRRRRGRSRRRSSIATSFLHHDVAFAREPVLVRRAARVHRGAARGDQAAHRRARPGAPVPRAVQRARSAAPRSRCPSIVGAIATVTIFVIALATHPAARYAGPVWLAIGLVVFVAVRHRPRRGADGAGDRRRTSGPCEAAVGFRQILVPMKLGIIGEEMLATAIKLAERARTPRCRRCT